MFIYLCLERNKVFPRLKLSGGGPLQKGHGGQFAPGTTFHFNLPTCSEVSCPQICPQLMETSKPKKHIL